MNSREIQQSHSTKLVSSLDLSQDTVVIVSMEEKEGPWSMKSYLQEEISVVNADYLLIFISFGTGIIDAFTFVELDVFAANMTGNTVFLALSAAQVDFAFLDAPRSIVALTSFWVGSFVSGQIGHRLGPRKRWWVALTLFMQGLFVLISAILLWSNAITGADIENKTHQVLGLICILSIGYGAQATTARGLQVSEIPTVVITSAMVDLFGDKNFYFFHNRGRNRRIGTILAIFLGAFVGGWIHNKVNSALTNAVAAAIKLLCVIFVMCFDSKQRAASRLAKNKDVV